MTTRDSDGPPVMASDTPSPSPGRLGEDVTRLTNELRELAHDHLELAKLETRLSVITALRMVIVSIVSAIVLVSAWLALVGSAVFGLIGVGVAPVFAMLFLAAANVLLAFVGWLLIKRQSRSLGWSATQRAIKPKPVSGERGVVK